MLILSGVSKQFGISVEDMLGRSRKAEIVEARHAAMYLMRENGMGLARIGRVFKVDHTSVMYACGTFQHRGLKDRLKKIVILGNAYSGKTLGKVL